MKSEPFPKRREKKTKKLQEKKTKKKMKKFDKIDSNEEPEKLCSDASGESSVDMCEEMHPIGYYINNREEMINQMFSVIKGHKLRTMLPPLLKDSTVEELKSYCLEELLGMSSKRIQSVLEGRELETSSESDFESSDPENENISGASPVDNKWSSDDMRTETNDQNLEEFDKDTLTDSEQNGMQNGLLADMDTLEIGITREEMGELLCHSSTSSNKICDRKRQSPMCESEGSVPVAKRVKGKTNIRKKEREMSKPVKVVKKNTAATKSISTPIAEERKEEEAIEREMTPKTDESKGKTLLEILELEMRARAIRALLKQQSGEEGSDGEEDSISPSDSHKQNKNNNSNVAETVENNNNVRLDEEDIVGSNNSAANSTQTGKNSTKDKGKEPILPHQGDSNKNKRDLTVLTNSTAEQIGVRSPPSKSHKEDSSSPSRTDFTLNGKHKDGDRHECNSHIAEVKVEYNSVSSAHESIKAEEGHEIKGKESDSGSVIELNIEDKESKPASLESITSDSESDYNDEKMKEELVREDGELSSEAGDKSSSESILEIEPEVSQNDIIVLDDSDDDVREIPTSTVLDTHDLSEIRTCSEPLAVTKIAKDHCEPQETLIISETSVSGPEFELQIEEDKSLSFFTEDKSEETLTEESRPPKIDTEDCSWATRWLQSKGVQKVVSTSKMCAKIRKRMKSVQKVVSVLTSESEKSSNPVIEGSVNEYKMLDKVKSTDSETHSDSSAEKVPSLLE